MENKAHKINFKHYIVNAVALTVEKTRLNGSGSPTVTFEISKAKSNQDSSNPPSTTNDTDKDTNKYFDHAGKWVFQLNPLTELPELIAVLLTYIQSCQFSYHSSKKNHALAVQWDTMQQILKITFLFAGENRFVNVPRSKVFELALFCSDALIQCMKERSVVSAGQSMSFSDIELYIARTFRQFKAHQSH